MLQLQILGKFLALGCTSFGGPAAHLGYFRRAFVEEARWLDEGSFGRLVAFCQFLPGPASSQLGFAIGLRRGGLLGGLMAFIGFTLPSFLVMATLATATAHETAGSGFAPIIKGLKCLAVVVVADAVLSMFRSFCPNRLTQGLCAGTAAALLLLPSLGTQFACLVLAAVVGVIALAKPSSESEIGQPSNGPQKEIQKGIRILPALIFGILFLLSLTALAPLFFGFFRAGSLVFGGGHVVLPLLQNGFSDSLSQDRFLLGYAAAQAVPGPMFTLASFLGAELATSQAWLGALFATAGIFLPGFLLVLAFGRAWEAMASRPRLAGGVAGLNAAVVGLLLAAFYDPVFVSAIHSSAHFALVLAGFFALRAFKAPLLAVVLVFAASGYLLPH